MIETKEQVIKDFQDKSRKFLEKPDVMSGLELDDAVVTLKRFVLTELHDEALGSLLAGLPRLIRRLDIAALTEKIGAIERGLEAHAEDQG